MRKFQFKKTKSWKVNLRVNWTEKSTITIGLKGETQDSGAKISGVRERESGNYFPNQVCKGLKTRYVNGVSITLNILIYDDGLHNKRYGLMGKGIF